MDLQKGEWDNLEGRVLIYAKLDADCDNCDEHHQDYTGVFATPDAAQFMKNTQMGPEQLEEQMHAMQESAEESLKKHGFHGFVQVQPIYAGKLQFDTTQNIETVDADILYIGEFNDAKLWQQATKHSIDYYFQRWSQQVVDRPDQPIQKEREFTEPTWSAIDPRELKNYMLQTYVAPLMDATRYKDEQRTEELSWRLAKFCEGSRFAPQLPDLYEAIEKNYHPDIVHAQVAQMAATRRDLFRAAGRIKKRISEYIAANHPETD